MGYGPYGWPGMGLDVAVVLVPLPSRAYLQRDADDDSSWPAAMAIAGTVSMTVAVVRDGRGRALAGPPS